MPDSLKGSPGIQADLLDYPSDSWQWEIIADTDNGDACKVFLPSGYSVWHISPNDLERELIRQYNSVGNGYNIMPGGGVNSHRQTSGESSLFWNGRTFERSQMQQVIYEAIDEYQFQHQHGVSRTTYQRQRDQEAQQQWEGWEGYQVYQESYQGPEPNRTGCRIVFIVLLLLVIFGLASGC